MPKLGDYLGQLLSEITMARMHADIESVKVAEFYADHPLLRNMPVPRFRMPDVEVDVPVVVQELEEPEPGESPHGTPPVPKIREVFDKVIASLLAKESITLSAANKKKLKTVLDERTAALTKPSDVPIDVKKVSNDFSQNAIEALGRLIKPEIKAVFEEKLKDSLRIEVVKIYKTPPRLKVLVTTGEIREAGPGEVITRLHLKISEEAFEWTTIETDEGKNDRLVIE